MCGDNFPFYISDCCGAPANEPGFPDSNMCSKCLKNAEFYDKREPITGPVSPKHAEILL